MNIMLTGFASAHHAFGEKDAFADNVRNYYVHVRENDIVHDAHAGQSAGGPLAPGGAAGQRTSPRRSCKETDAGHRHHRRAHGLDAGRLFQRDHGDAVHLSREQRRRRRPMRSGSASRSHPGAALHLPPVGRAPGGRLADGLSAVVAASTRRTPWRCSTTCWCRGSGCSSTAMPTMCNGLYNRTGAMPQVMHQFSTKNLAKAEFMMGLGFAIAKSTNIDQHLHVQGMLAELIQFTEFCRACLRASEADAAAQRARRVHAGRDAAMDGADDVRPDVPADVRDHPDAGRRRSGRGAVLRRDAKPGLAGRGDLFSGGQLGFQNPHQAVPAGVRCRGIIVFRPAAAL